MASAGEDLSGQTEIADAVNQVSMGDTDRCLVKNMPYKYYLSIQRFYERIRHAMYEMIKLVLNKFRKRKLSAIS